MNDTFGSKCGVSVSRIEVIVLPNPLGHDHLVLEIISALKISFLSDKLTTEWGVGEDADPVGTGGVSDEVLSIRW